MSTTTETVETLTRAPASKYSVNGFDIDNWCREFWSDTSASAHVHISMEEIASLVMLDQKLLAKHEHEGTDYFAVSRACEELGGLMLLVRKRTLALGFKCTEGVCALIQELAHTPAQAVMYCVALAWAWDVQAVRRGDAVPSCMWILDNWSRTGSMSGQPTGLSDKCTIPGPEHVRMMWDKQKAAHVKFPESDNYIDRIEVVA